MVKKIDSKIVGFKVKSQEQDAQPAAPAKPEVEVVYMHEDMPRPEKLLGTTYKLKTPQNIFLNTRCSLPSMM